MNSAHADSAGRTSRNPRVAGSGVARILPVLLPGQGAVAFAGEQILHQAVGWGE